MAAIGGDDFKILSCMRDPVLLFRSMESARKTFFRFFRPQSFLCKTKAKMLKISVGLP